LFGTGSEQCELYDLDGGMGGSNVLAGPNERVFSSGKRQEACKSEYLHIGENKGVKINLKRRGDEGCVSRRLYASVF
jgi:hypothetical protein